MWMFEGRNGNKLYKRILGSILAEGSEVSPRGLKTRVLYKPRSGTQGVLGVWFTP